MNGSIESHLTPDFTFSNAASAFDTRACRSTVVPIHAFGGISNSAMRFGNLVRHKKFQSGAALISRNTASIHSAGTQRPNRSAIEQVKTFLKRVSVSASGGTRIWRGARSIDGRNVGANLFGYTFSIRALFAMSRA